jgi:hypothetical protein
MRKKEIQLFYGTKSTPTRKTGGLNLSVNFGRTKAKARQCFYVELASGWKVPGFWARIKRIDWLEGVSKPLFRLLGLLDSAKFAGIIPPRRDFTKRFESKVSQNGFSEGFEMNSQLSMV